MIMSWEEKFHILAKRQEEIVRGELPFVEPGTLKEEFVFNELQYIKTQMGLIVKYIK